MECWLSPRGSYLIKGGIKPVEDYINVGHTLDHLPTVPEAGLGEGDGAGVGAGVSATKEDLKNNVTLSLRYVAVLALTNCALSGNCASKANG
jgi:hypothetical protein